MEKNNTSTLKRFAQKGVFPYQFAFTLLIPLRNIFLSPRKLIQRLELKDNDRVLEVGPGPGYFSAKVAQSISSGILTLCDIQQEMLDLAKRRLERRKIFNIEYHLCNGISFPFENNRYDVIYMVTVLGEIENQQQYIEEFYRLLRPGGCLSFSEQAGDPDKMSMAEIKDLLGGTGFQYDKFYGTENNFTINFRKV